MKDKKNTEVSFGDYVDSYQLKIQESIDFAGQDADFFIQVKADMVIKLVNKYCNSLQSAKVLDVGCGLGLVDRHLAGSINNLFGVDIEEDVVSKAKINNPGVNYSVYDGEELPFENNIMDFCFAINVMHHVPPTIWQNFTNEMHRVLKPGGAAVVFEHNPLNPLTRRVVSKCEFDRGAVLLSHNKITNLFINSGFALTEDGYILFFPFKGGFFRTIEKRMKWIPLGAQQFIIGKKIN